MKFHRVWAVFIRQFYLIKSNPTRLSNVFLWLILDILQWGFVSKYLDSLGWANFNFITVILGAIILWEFFSRIQQGMMTAFLEDIWSQNFINYFASPLQVREYVGGLTLTSIGTTSLGFLASLLLAGLLFGYNLFRIGFLLLPIMLILFIFGVAVGIFMAALIFRLGPSAEWLGWPIPMLVSIFSGVFYPIATLPAGFQAVAKILPSSYVFEQIRSVLEKGSFSPLALVLGFLLAIVYLLLTYAYFIRVYRRNLKSGAISRFSAESA
jgi:ABC-2 type transport system permease protein